MDGIVKTNARQPSQVSKILYKHVGSIKDKTIGILGLAFKPGTDDVRESASIKIASELVRGGSRLIAHDPEAKDNFKKVMDKKRIEVFYYDNWQDMVRMSDIIIISTLWDEYRALPDLDLSNKVIFDARHSFTPTQLNCDMYLAI